MTRRSVETSQKATRHVNASIRGGIATRNPRGEVKLRSRSDARGQTKSATPLRASALLKLRANAKAWQHHGGRSTTQASAAGITAARRRRHTTQTPRGVELPAPRVTWHRDPGVRLEVWRYSKLSQLHREECVRRFSACGRCSVLLLLLRRSSTQLNPVSHLC